MADAARRQQAEAEAATAAAQAASGGGISRTAARPGGCGSRAHGGEQADQQRQQAEEGKSAKCGERLEQQLNMILETRETRARADRKYFRCAVRLQQIHAEAGRAGEDGEGFGHPAGLSRTALQLEGHTDSIGTDEYNMVLSQKRADAVREYLVSQGVQDATCERGGVGQGGPGGVERYRMRGVSRTAAWRWWCRAT